MGEEKLTYLLQNNQMFIIIAGGILVALYQILSIYRSSVKRKADFNRTIFMDTLKGINSTNESQRISSAILLRRFLQRDKREGGSKLEYRDEVLSIISSLLRVVKYGELQKTLADSLSYSENLSNIDLQATNLQEAYLKPRTGHNQISMIHADLYKSDLSYASFNHVDASHSAFCEAMMMRTVFRNCTLCHARFDRSDLYGARFIDCKLDGANFYGATNIPDEIQCKLNENGIYCPDTPATPYVSNKTTRKVFVSCLGNLTAEQDNCFSMIDNKLKKLGIETVRYSRLSYRNSGQINEIRAAMETCCAVLILGFKSVLVQSGYYRPNTDESKTLKGIAISTPWNGIEAGMASALKKPLLILSEQGISDGIFDENINDKNLTRIPLHANPIEIDKVLTRWISSI